MACYHPLKAIVIPNSFTVNGKRNMRILGSLEEFPKGIPEEAKLTLPCGQCVGCRMQYSREWANRCMMELRYHDSAYFVTLTYDDDHVPKVYEADESTGEAAGLKALSLCKRDWQLFMKRLRKAFPDDSIRFFAAGEYGSITYRPHYHAIIYGLHLDDLKVYKQSTLGHTYYNSDKLSEVWKQGHVVVADVTWETCAYTARYVMKKKTGKESAFYETFGIEPEFTLMSRKPGIARQYFDDHPDMYESDFINLSTEKKGLKFRPPRYFDKLYDLEHPEEMDQIKNVRQKMAAEAQKAKLQRTTLSPDELLQVEERSFERKIKSLRRPLE